jgi:uncharacterized protein (UPF0332 family)
MNEITSLISRAEKYLGSAQILIEKDDYESAVSRTYYAMFYAAEAVLLSEKTAFSTHKGVLSAFGERFVRDGPFPRESGKWLNQAFEKRQLGDYEHRFVISREEAVEILANGRKFVKMVSDYVAKV